MNALCKLKKRIESLQIATFSDMLKICGNTLKILYGIVTILQYIGEEIVVIENEYRNVISLQRQRDICETCADYRS